METHLEQISNNFLNSTTSLENNKEGNYKMAAEEKILRSEQIEEMSNEKNDVSLSDNVVSIGENESLQDENKNKVQSFKESIPADGTILEVVSLKEKSDKRYENVTVDMPSTSGSDSFSEKVETGNTKSKLSTDQNLTNKRSKSKGGTTSGLICKDEDTPDEDSKRQKMNEADNNSESDFDLELCKEVTSDAERDLLFGPLSSDVSTVDLNLRDLPNDQSQSSSDTETSPFSQSPQLQSDIEETSEDQMDTFVINSSETDTSERITSESDTSERNFSDSSDDIDAGDSSDRYSYHVDDELESYFINTPPAINEDAMMLDAENIRFILQRKPLKHTWFPIRELVNRQLGINDRLPEKFYGSLYAVELLDLSCKLTGHNGCVNTINFNRRGNLLASSSDDLNVIIWDWAAKKKIAKYKSGHTSNVFQAKWLPLNESLMVTSARDGHVRLLDLVMGTNRKLAVHVGPCNKIATHEETPYVILSVGEDSKVLSIDVRDSTRTKLLKVKDRTHNVELFSVHINPLRSNEFCVAGQMASVKIYDRRRPTSHLDKMCPNHLSDSTSNVTCAVYNYNGTEILASYNDDNIYLFDTINERPFSGYLHRYRGHRNYLTVKGVNFFGPKSEYVMSGSDCKNIFIWDKNTEAIVQWMVGDEEGTVNCLEPHPNIPMMATSGLDYDVKIWIPSAKNIGEASSRRILDRASLHRCVKWNISHARKARHEPQSVYRSNGSFRSVTMSDSASSDSDFEGGSP